MQQFVINFEGSKTLKLTEPSVFDFKILRYADLLMDTYINVDLPNIWSPIQPPDENIPIWRPYEFKWIDNLGIKMIQEVRIVCGNQELLKFSGNYLLATIQRDFSADKKQLINDMIGNVPELTDPANYGLNSGNYPNVYYSESSNTQQPSIMKRNIIIPLNAWFCLLPQMAFPLVALQNNELHIYITFRPINELFVIRDVFDVENNFPFVAPNFNQYYMQFYRFLQPPPNITLDINSYTDKRGIWNSNIYLQCNYCFLSNEEQELFALQEQKYLIKQVHETIFYNNFGASKINLDSIGMITSWMFYLQRSDANLRNEWSNYTNWEYKYPPNFIIPANEFCAINDTGEYLCPSTNTDGSSTGLYVTNSYNNGTVKDILLTMGILFDGEYRENTQMVNLYKYIEKMYRTPSYSSDGPLLYNFCLDTNLFNTQPTGAINMSRFNNIQLEFTTITPPVNYLAQSLIVCDPSLKEVIGVNKNNWELYQYTYNLYLFEERVNMVIFLGGNCSVLYAN